MTKQRRCAAEPLAVVVAGADVHDAKRPAETIDAVVVERPDETEVRDGQHPCLDKGYGQPHRPGCGHVRRTRAARPAHRRGEARRRDGEKEAPGAAVGGGANHRVAQPLAWLNRWRGTLVRYEKKACNYLGTVRLACALLWFRRLHRLTT